ncbi:MAG: HAD-IA family hydrolase [archaeon]|nr:MAG: HAD-IA family hydrolase [archaeon]
MRTRVVFFDLGGTLLVMRRDKIFSRVLSASGFTVPLESVHRAYVGNEPWWLSRYGNRELTPDQTEEAYREKDAMVFAALFPEERKEKAIEVSKLARSMWPQLEKDIPLELYPDAEPVMEELVNDGYSVGLVSNAPPDTSKVVESLGLDRYASTVVISGLVGCSKPSPEIFRIALRRAGFSPEEAVHVGDVYEADVVGARSAGMLGVLIDRDDTQSGLECPRIRSLLDVYRHLE